VHTVFVAKPIAPPAARRETLLVLLAAGAIAAGSAAFIRAQRGSGGDPRSDLLPWQKTFKELEPPAQRVFSSLREGLLEAENRRSEEGRWPDTAALAELGAPPFAPDPVAPEPRQWSFRGAGRAANYAGVASAPGGDGRAYLLAIQETDDRLQPGVPAGPKLDETHHALADGTLIHVSFWFRDETPRLPQGVINDPSQSGWTQIVLGREAR
jgi:hypothetical protein